MNTYENLTIRNWAVEDRPREKLIQKGVYSLSDVELIALLIGSGTKNSSAVEVARKILSHAGNSLEKMGKFTFTDLKKHKGIGQARAVTILAALELGRRRSASSTHEAEKINCSSDAFKLMHPILGDLVHEEFWILLLNRSHKIIAIKRISQGGITGTVTDIRMILKLALDNLATSIILCHNHPSGNLQPSDADISITQRINDSGNIMDIALLDHIIIGGSHYYSFADETGMFGSLKRDSQ